MRLSILLISVPKFPTEQHPLQWLSYSQPWTDANTVTPNNIWVNLKKPLQNLEKKETY